jgi:pyrroloquinoline quinone biosynthesis protein B
MQMKPLLSVLLLLLTNSIFSLPQGDPFMIVLGVAQDGGYPHIGCQKECCTRAWKNDSLARSVVSLALVDPSNKKWWLFEATPDITRQLHQFQQLTDSEYNFLPDGIFITHAHIGHYTGLMYLGKEAMNTKDVSVYVLPKMKSFLENNGPWSQLVNIHNIKITALTADSNFNLSDGISVIPFTVPHRDEYSETAGFRINAGERKYLFIPDIDKWQKWNKDIVEEVKQVDVAFLDGTCNRPRDGTRPCAPYRNAKLDSIRTLRTGYWPLCVETGTRRRQARVAPHRRKDFGSSRPEV